MQKQKQLQYAVVGVLGFALLFMTIGFAAYAQLTSLDIASATSTLAPVHKIGFEAGSYQESDTSIPALSKSIKSHSIDLSLKLEQPGDSYAALVNIVNDGNVDEILDGVRLSGIDESLANIVDFRVSLDDAVFIGDTDGINMKFSTGGVATREQAMITVEYRSDAENIGPLNLDLSAQISFKK